MEDLDKALVAAILRDGKPALKRARDKGLRPDLLRGEGQALYQFLVDYHLRYDDLPPVEVIKGSTGFDLPELPANLHAEFLVDAVSDRKIYEFVHKGYTQLGSLLDAQPPNAQKLVQSLEEIILALRREQLTEVKVESLFALGPEVLAHYEKVKGGAHGILTPWPILNESTLGFWPMDLVLVCARIATGKTWIAILLTLCAWQQGKRVLFASTEISRMRIAMRLYAAMLRLPYREFSGGRLTMHAEPRLYAAVKEMLHKEGLYVVGGNFDFRVEALSAAIDEVRPDLLILDGAYLLRTTGASRTEKAANAFDELKRLALRHQIPVVATHQFNREVKSNIATTVRAESIGLTDVAGWNADLIYGLVQTDDMKKDRKMQVKPLKVREGVGEDFEMRWDLDLMDFTELGRVVQHSANASDAAEYDSGTTSTSGGSEDVPF